VGIWGRVADGIVLLVGFPIVLLYTVSLNCVYLFVFVYILTCLL